MLSRSARVICFWPLQVAASLKGVVAAESRAVQDLAALMSASNFDKEKDYQNMFLGVLTNFLAPALKRDGVTLGTSRMSVDPDWAITYQLQNLDTLALLAVVVSAGSECFLLAAQLCVVSLRVFPHPCALFLSYPSLSRLPRVIPFSRLPAALPRYQGGEAP